MLNIFLTGEFHNDPYADDDHGWGFNGYTANRLDDQFFLGKDILVAPIVNPGYLLSFLLINQSIYDLLIPSYLPHSSILYPILMFSLPALPPHSSIKPKANRKPAMHLPLIPFSFTIHSSFPLLFHQSIYLPSIPATFVHPPSYPSQCNHPSFQCFLKAVVRERH